MRKLHDHLVGSEGLSIDVLDGPGPGGANHHYRIFWRTKSDEPELDLLYGVCDIKFQNGTVAEEGINGVTQEALLAIVIDRLRGFQGGMFHCRENAIALTHIEEALMWLNKRTLHRQQRGVEGEMIR